MYCLGQSVELGREGMYCGILDLLFVMAGIFRFEAGEGQFGILAALLHLILFLFLFIYRIRIFLQILKLFGLGKQWLILWLLVDWLPLLILGIGKKYQPVKENLREGAARIPKRLRKEALPSAGHRAEYSGSFPCPAAGRIRRREDDSDQRGDRI